MKNHDRRADAVAHPAADPAAPADLETQPTRVTSSDPMQPSAAPTLGMTFRGGVEERLFPPGVRVAGRYRVLEVLGSGGMGMVYRVYDDMLDVELALKVLRPEVAHDGDFLQRFKDELLLARKVSHRHVVSNYDLGVHEGMHFLTMDLVVGRSLEDVLREKGRLPTADAVRIVRQVAGALAEAHRQGIVHRDLKPANILLDSAGDAFVTDFGIARSLGSKLTKTGEILGTPDYLSPEQARGERVDGRSDVFTLGIIFIQMLSGKLPFPGGTLLEIVAQRMAGRVLSLEELGIEVPAALSKVIERCVEKDLDKRYPTADRLVEALDEYERPRAHGVPSKRALLWAAAVALAVAVAAFFVGREGVAPGAAVDGGTLTSPPTDSPPVPVALPTPEPHHSVAVLPFPEATGSPQLAWAANGVAEMLASALAENENLRVIESVRVFQILQDLGFQARLLRDEDFAQLADLLRVDRLVFGDLQVIGNQIQLAMSLLEADLPGSPSRLVDTRRGELREMFDLVDDLAAQLRKELEVETPSAGHPPLTPSAQAMQSYTEGLEYLSRRDTLNAAPALEQAVAEDPEFLAAWVRLSQAYQSLGRFDDALEAARKAVAVTGDLRGRAVYEAQAQEALLRGEPEQAQRFLEELVQRYPNDTGARVNLAEAYGQQGRFAEASSRLKEVVEVDPSPRAWYLLGRFSIESGDVRPAVDEYLVQALIRQKKLKNRQGEAEVYNALGVAYERLGELPRAAENYDTAAETYREIGDERGLATSLHNLSVIHFLQGDFDKSEDNIRMALDIHRKMGNVAGVAELYNLRGAFEEERGRYPEALEFYRRALKERGSLGDERALAESHANVGFVYFLLGEYDNALLYLERAIELYRKNEDQHGITITLQSIGFCQIAQGAWPEATRSFVESLELSRDMGERLATSVSLGNLGLIAQNQGRYMAAFSSYAEAQAILVEMGDTRGQVEFALNEAEALLELGMLEKARAKLDHVAEVQAEGGNREQRLAWQVLRSEVLFRQGAAKEASAQLAALEGELEATQSPITRIKVAVVSGLIALREGHVEGARQVLAPAVAEAERLGHAILRLRAGEALARVEIATQDFDGAADRLRKLLRTSDDGGGWARAFRLHQLLADVLRSEGNAAAAECMDRARREVARIRQNLDDTHRRAFDQLPEVRELL